MPTQLQTRMGYLTAAGIVTAANVTLTAAGLPLFKASRGVLPTRGLLLDEAHRAVPGLAVDVSDVRTLDRFSGGVNHQQIQAVYWLLVGNSTRAQALSAARIYCDAVRAAVDDVCRGSFMLFRHVRTDPEGVADSIGQTPVRLCSVSFEADWTAEDSEE